MKKFIFLALIIINAPLIKAEIDPSKIDRRMGQLTVPDFDLSKQSDLPVPPVSMLNFDSLPISIEPLILPSEKIILRSGGKDVYSKSSPSVVKILTKESSGSGAIISKDGFIISNWHVVKGYSVVGVIFLTDSQKNQSNPKMYLADVLRTDPKVDLALIKLQKKPKSLTPFSLGKIPAIGSDVHAIGHPLGQDWTYTKGYISQIRSNYSWQYKDGSSHRAEVVQTQTPINPGNSGGPLISDKGRLIGVNSFGNSKAQGLNFAVSVNELKKFLSQKKTEVGEYVDPNTLVGCVDTNKDGKNDSCGFDLTGNGQIDVLANDNNFDGIIDAYVIVDENFNYVGFVKPIEEDGATIMLWIIDLNQDGKADKYGLDYDRDGRPDFIRDFPA